jgi:hypothetical protein
MDDSDPSAKTEELYQGLQVPIIQFCVVNKNEK